MSNTVLDEQQRVHDDENPDRKAIFEKAKKALDAGELRGIPPWHIPVIRDIMKTDSVRTPQEISDDLDSLGY